MASRRTRRAGDRPGGAGRYRGAAGTRGLPAIRVAGGPAFGVVHGRAPSRTRVQDHRGGPAVDKADELSLRTNLPGAGFARRSSTHANPCVDSHRHAPRDTHYFRQKRTLISRWPELPMRGVALATAEPEQAGVVIAVPGWRLCGGELRGSAGSGGGSDASHVPSVRRKLAGEFWAAAWDCRALAVLAAAWFTRGSAGSVSGGPGWSRAGWFAAAGGCAPG
jgi:hypothetical protein